MERGVGDIPDIANLSRGPRTLVLISPGDFQISVAGGYDLEPA